MCIIDDEEVICKTCGSIFSLSSLKFIKTEYCDNDKSLKDLCFDENVEISRDDSNLTPLNSVYSCPICGINKSLEDRRKRIR